jgi:6-pyruvoyltetrahydropterin/6-carboxytetrahydropterin synthase
VLEFQPTSELLAEHLYAYIFDRTNARDAAAVQAIRVWESPRRWAEFTQVERSGR